MLLALAAAGGLLLLLTCANVGGLLAARGAARTREMSVRAALGAGRGRLARQLLVEATVLTMIAGAMGISVAQVSVRAVAGTVQRQLGVTVPGGDANLRVDASVLAVAILVSARELDQQFEWTAHEPAALKEGLEPAIVDVVKHRKPVDGLGEKEAVIVSFGRSTTSRN